jgi:hypothetical protein
MQNAVEKFGEESSTEKFFIDETPKITSFGQSALYEPLCVPVLSVVWSGL